MPPLRNGFGVGGYHQAVPNDADKVVGTTIDTAGEVAVLTIGEVVDQILAINTDKVMDRMRVGP